MDYVLAVYTKKINKGEQICSNRKPICFDWVMQPQILKLIQNRDSKTKRKKDVNIDAICITITFYKSNV